MSPPPYNVYIPPDGTFFNDYLIKHISPTKSSRFKNIEITSDINKADYLFCIGGCIQKLARDKFSRERISALRVEPPTGPSGRRHIKDGLGDLAFHSPVFFHCETLNRDYFFLKRAKPQKKINKCACYISSKRIVKHHVDRYNWLLKYVDLYPNDLDIFSVDDKVKKDFKGCFKKIEKEKERITRYKKKGLFKKRLFEAFKYKNISKYKFFLALDNEMNLKDWCNDHLFDPILCYCYTLYCGCPNISDYLDMKSIFQFRIDDEESFRKVHEVLSNTNVDSSVMSSIDKNRNIILDDLNFFNLINTQIEKMAS